MTVKSLRARQAEATRALLIATARERFTEHGYSATSIEEIIQQAGVAKGALYHHFSGKETLFRAVYDEVLMEVVTSALTAAVSAGERWTGVRAGLSAFLDACIEPTFRRVVVLDSVAVLQHEREAGLEHVELPLLRTVLAPLMETGLLPDVNLEALAHMALGGLYGAALYIARSPSPDVARRDADIVLEIIIAGIERTSTRAGLDTDSP